MHPSVRTAWHEFSQPFEGKVHSLYVDVLGLVTTGVGNLIDSPAEAAKLPWKLPDGSLASREEVTRQWHVVKNDRERLKKLHYRYAAELTAIRITDEDIEALVAKKLASNDEYITRWLPNFQEIPADAQLGIHSLAWAAGPGFNQKFPNFTRQALAGKWGECAVSGQLRATGPDGTPNPGVIPRNRANKLCFENAEQVVANNEDSRVLHWPNRYQAGLTEPPTDTTDPPSPSIAPPLDPQALPVISLGSTGDHVRLLQAQLALASKGQRIVVDGSFGPRTEKFVRDFQRQRGLTSDGVVGPRTWARLLPAPVPAPEDNPPLEPPVDHAANDRAANLLGVRTLESLELGVPDDHDDEPPKGNA